MTDIIIPWITIGAFIGAVARLFVTPYIMKDLVKDIEKKKKLVDEQLKKIDERISDLNNQKETFEWHILNIGYQLRKFEIQVELNRCVEKFEAIRNLNPTIAQESFNAIVWLIGWPILTIIMLKAFKK